MNKEECILNSYEFSMERVLKWREDIEKANMEDLAIIQNQLREQKSILNDLIKEEEKIRANSPRYRDVNQLKYQHLYKQKIEEKIQKQGELIDKTNEKLEDARQELIEAQKNRKIMEKLKEKDMSAYKASINNAEQKELDEIAVLKHQNQMFL